MSYVQKVLQPGEAVLGTTRIHWFVYLPTLLLLALSVALLAATTVTPPDGQIYVAALAVVVALAGTVSWIKAALQRATTELAVTDHRIIYKTGLIGRRTIEMNRSKVESVDVEQTLGGRLFNYGTIIVRGTGGTLEPMRQIADPLPFRSMMTVGP